jgi:hypothetical protein
MNQTMIDVSDRLVVHVLLLTHERVYIILFASLILDILMCQMFSNMKLMCPKHTDDDPPSLI